MKILSPLLLLVLLAAVWRLYSLGVVVNRQQETIAQQQQQNATLTAAKVSGQDAFAMQEKCAAQAEKVFRERGYKLNGSTNSVSDVLQSHFNAERNKCFMTIETMNRDGAQSRFLLDAFEQREYAEYFWMVDSAKKYWENPPKICKEIPTSGDEQICHSDDEYKAIVKRNME